jgi:hypothetical protein
VIGVTTFYSREQWRRALSAGCCDLIAHPIRGCDQLRAKLDGVLAAKAA